jgi:hypothetical protein
LISIFFVGHTDPARAVALLHPRRDRPSGGAADEQRDDLTPFQLTQLHLLPKLDSQAYRIAEDQSGLAAVRDFDPPNDRLGSFASDQSGQRLRRMSAVPPIATKPK